MDLKEFSKLVVTSSNHAKNLFSLLIGHFPRGESAGKALIGFYESFEKSIKSDEKIFSDVMFKYFCNYNINEDNIKYYEQFEKYWNNANKEIIKKFNPQQKWSETNYKNSLEFSSATMLYKNKEMIQFLNKNDKEIEKLVKKDKPLFIKNFSKNHIWKNLIEYKYKDFTKFCEKYNFDKLTILQSVLESHQYTFQKIMLESNQEILDDIFSNKEILNTTDFVKPNSKKSYSGNYNVLDMTVHLMLLEKYKEVFNLMNLFPEELKLCLQEYMYVRKPLNEINLFEQDCWNEYSQKISYYLKDGGSLSRNEALRNFGFKQIEGVIEKFSKIDKILLKLELDKMTENKKVLKHKL